MNYSKAISIFFVILLIVSLTSAVLNKIDWIVFYVIAAVSALFASKVLPKMKK